MWSGRGDSLVAYPHDFGVLATSICNNLPYRFRLLVHNFLGIIFVDQKKEKKSVFLWLRCRWDSAICSVFELFWCFWVVFRDFVFGYLRVFTGSRNLIFNSTWCLQIHYDRLGKDGLFSHKEVTVLFVPDFSECLPSLDSWRDQWAMACSQEGCCREGAPTFCEKRGL